MRIAAALAALSVGCALGDVPLDEETDPTDPVAGSYELVSTYDLTESDVGFLGDVIGPLAGLRDAPGETVMTILENTGDDITNILDLLPGARDQVIDAIDDYVNEQVAAGSTAGEVIGWVDEIAMILSNFEVISRFEIGSFGEDGYANATHTLSAVRFQLRGETQHIDTPDVIDSLSVARDVECEMIEGAGGLDINDHAFELPLGELAVAGFNNGLKNTLGVNNISEALDLAVNCTNVAASVGEQCIGQICISETQLTDLCNQGLDAVAGELEAAIESIDFAALRMNGHAFLEAKADATGQVDRWNRGNWTSAFDLDGLVIGVNAEFAATRL